MVVDVYSQYFFGSCVYNGVERRGALVKLTADSEAGSISYAVSVCFFPHAAEDDFAVSGDAYAEETVYAARGRRSRKREEGLLAALRAEADALAASLGGAVDWETPLRDARRA